MYISLLYLKKYMILNNKHITLEKGERDIYTVNPQAIYSYINSFIINNQGLYRMYRYTDLFKIHLFDLMSGFSHFPWSCLFLG